MAYRPTRKGITYEKPTKKDIERIINNCRPVDVLAALSDAVIGPCIIWLGRIDTDGYGEMKFRKQKRFVHRVAYAYYYDVAEMHGQDVEHVCRQRACCNPLHLKLMPPKDNRVDRADPGEATVQFNKNNLQTREAVPF